MDHPDRPQRSGRILRTKTRSLKGPSVPPSSARKPERRVIPMAGPSESQARSASPGEVRGGRFLREAPTQATVMLPENLSPEARAIADLTRTFVTNRVLPRMAELEQKDLALLRSLFREAGELGILGVEVPEAYGGSGLGRVPAIAVAEALGPSGGFSVTHAAHSGLAMLPIAFFGTPEQKARYLPDLARGIRVGGYALTEPGHGSDALRGRTGARRTPDGGYVLHGEKQWITNSGIADLWVVFAHLEGSGLTAFLVERDTPGLTIGPEYEKLGIRSSSTRPLVLDDVLVPADHLLGEPGHGHRVAMSVLDVSRLNLGAAAVGTGKWLVREAVRFAGGRIQFGRPILEFGLIREKIARMEIRLWALEAAVYRTAGLIDRMQAEDPGGGVARAASEFALECAAVKVLGSEVLDFVVDETLQIHGGYGYMKDFPVERAYRDARISRIFEGTNEINRLTIAETMLRRSVEGETAPGSLPPGSGQEPDTTSGVADPRVSGRRALLPVSRLKEAFWLVAAPVLGLAEGRVDRLAEQEEEVLGSLADGVIAIYAAESAALRAEGRASSGGRERDPWADRLASEAVRDAASLLREAGGRILRHVTVGAVRREALERLDRRTALDPEDGIATLREIADRVSRAGGFVP